MTEVKPTLQEEFQAVKQYCPDDKLGIDIGCGSNIIVIQKDRERAISGEN